MRQGNELDDAIAAAADEATLVRTMIAARNMKISQITAIRNEKRGAVPLVSVLEELSARRSRYHLAYRYRDQRTGR